MLIVGEVRTGLLHNSVRLPRPTIVELLEIRPGRRVRVTNRPVNRSVSPDGLVCVDCRVPTVPLTKARGIGTVASHAVVTGGLVLQSAARTQLDVVTNRDRRPWSHYAARRGVVEVIGKANLVQLAAGYRAEKPDSTTLDLGAISEHLVSVVQMRPQLDRRTAMRSRPTRTRWTAMVEDRADPAVRLHVDSEELRTVELALPSDLLPHAERFCEDLALHDWLLTAMDNVVEAAEKDIINGIDPMRILGAAVDRLVR
ncbi:SCO2521 family protein, partial [Actinophytocola sp.]|uniref:SCO2521 family protein n=1 Tax=Actinophytocola sp. TaxID=1872138 RepID=UPI002D80CE7B